MNDRDAKIIVDENIYLDDVISPTRHIEYACSCGKGKIIR